MSALTRSSFPFFIINPSVTPKPISFGLRCGGFHHNLDARDAATAITKVIAKEKKTTLKKKCLHSAFG